MQRIKIGLSLPTAYLSGDYVRGGETWYKMFGTLADCLGVLRKAGVSSIEVNDLHMERPITQIEPAVENILKYGFHLTVHIFLPDLDKQNVFPDSLQKTFRILKDKNQDSPLILHGHNFDDYSSREEAVYKTITDLTGLVKRFRDNKMMNPVALELCRHRKGGPVGVTYQEIQDMVDAVKEDNIGICWDMGHTLSNINSQAWDNPFPAEAFLDRVIHTHIHALDKNQKTHGPLGKKDDLVNSFLILLKTHKYQGIYNFELYPERWGESFVLRKELVLQSIKTLQEILTRQGD